MAKLTLDTKQIPVQTFKTQKTVILELTVNEAAWLKALTGHVGGVTKKYNAHGRPCLRRFNDKIWSTLDASKEIPQWYLSLPTISLTEANHIESKPEND